MKEKYLSEAALEMIAQRFRILGDLVRLQILQALRKGEMTVSDLTDAVDISQPNASKHLRILHDAGIISREKRGNSVYYSITDESIFEMCEVVCDSLAA